MRTQNQYCNVPAKDKLVRHKPVSFSAMRFLKRLKRYDKKAKVRKNKGARLAASTNHD